MEALVIVQNDVLSPVRDVAVIPGRRLVVSTADSLFVLSLSPPRTLVKTLTRGAVHGRMGACYPWFAVHTSKEVVVLNAEAHEVKRAPSYSAVALAQPLAGGVLECGARGRECRFLDEDGRTLWSAYGKGTAGACFDRRAYSLHYEGTIHVFERKGKVGEWRLDGSGSVAGLEVCGGRLYAGLSSTVYVLNPTSGEVEERWELSLPEEGRDVAATAFSISPDCRYVAVAVAQKRRLVIIKADTRRPVLTLPLAFTPKRVAWGEDGVAVAGEEAVLFLSLPARRSASPSER